MGPRGLSTYRHYTIASVVMAELPASRASALYDSVGNVAGWLALSAVGVAVLLRANRRRHKLPKADRR